MRGFDGALPLSAGGKRAGRYQGAPGFAGGKPRGKREQKRPAAHAAGRGKSAESPRTISGQSADDQRTISGRSASDQRPISVRSASDQRQISDRAVALRPQRVKAKASAGAALTLWNLRATTQPRRAEPSQNKNRIGFFEIAD